MHRVQQMAENVYEGRTSYLRSVGWKCETCGKFAKTLGELARLHGNEVVVERGIYFSADLWVLKDNWREIAERILVEKEREERERQERIRQHREERLAECKREIELYKQKKKFIAYHVPYGKRSIKVWIARELIDDLVDIIEDGYPYPYPRIRVRPPPWRDVRIIKLKSGTLIAVPAPGWNVVEFRAQEIIRGESTLDVVELHNAELAVKGVYFRSPKARMGTVDILLFNMMDDGYAVVRDVYENCFMVLPDGTHHEVPCEGYK